jgi:hypothetical protein
VVLVLPREVSFRDPAIRDRELTLSQMAVSVYGTIKCIEVC